MQIAVSGGKGGTGKSTIAINLAIALKEHFDLVLADLDVEAPNDHLLLGVELQNEEPVELFMPRFDYSKCTHCRKCAEVCEEHAIITMRDGTPFLMPNLCSGCAACEIVCPVPGAILPGKKLMGHTYLTETPYGFPLVTGRLLEGEERAMPIVSRAKKRAQSLNKELLLVDTAAGTSNTVSKALEDSKLIIAVTEPTPLGLHDSELILRLARLMDIPAMIIVNRSDLGDVGKVREIAERYSAEIIAEIPYSENVIRSYVEGRPIVLSDYPEAQIFRKIAERVVEFIGGGE
ncbi:cobalamin biosynthesis protein CobQ [Thermococcus sp. GR7]|uniref:nucleotide-binding protein n=1 Tax=unclassified Thermococcus TaxID=2627626 RepID=UPI0014313743|nr:MULTISPECIES: ATP-binding protein [unclassified Thermococcus]NJE47560.1 cobalamin biosynthesis protein CobQ [Thermococcus sp. GR7]NJE79348.1 cobalamin biosynthesis protein CobQ [Thermococcus sp. GR4]NJF22484.1 cobalamin biosynthesis protein CobQ [Thermococcus sp. GR5]